VSDFTGTVLVDGAEYAVAGSFEPALPSDPPAVGGPVELDYVENTGGVITVTSQTEGTGGGQSFIVGHPVEYDGATRICVEVFCAAVEPDFHNAIQFNLYEGTSDLGIMSTSGTGGGSGDVTRSSFTVMARRFLTPTAGTHTYQIRVWKTGGSLNRVYCGFGGGPDPGDPPNYMPAYYRITRA